MAVDSLIVQEEVDSAKEEAHGVRPMKATPTFNKQAETLVECLAEGGSFMPDQANKIARCRGIPGGCVEMGQDHGGLEPRNRAKRESPSRRVHTDTVDRMEKTRREATVGRCYSAK